MRVRVGLWSLLIVGAACGGSSAPPGSSSNPPPSPPVQSTSMIEFAFSPPSPSIKAGTTVRWVNNGTTVHTATSDNAGVWNSQDVAPAHPGGWVSSANALALSYGVTVIVPVML